MTKSLNKTKQNLTRQQGMESALRHILLNGIKPLKEDDKGRKAATDTHDHIIISHTW